MTMSADNYLATNQWHQEFLDMMSQGAMIGNCEADFIYYDIDNVVIPATITVPKHNNCYAVSLLSLISGYGEDELPKLKNPYIRKACSILLKATLKPLQWAKLHQLQTLNNQCLSTNMYSSDWKQLKLSDLRLEALKTTPNTALLLRSLNTVQHNTIIQSAKQDGWIPIVTRQVYLHCDWANFSPGADIKKDLKLLKQPGWEFRKLTSYAECETAKQLYDDLYLNKYSHHNIHFSARYLYHATQHNLLELFGLFHHGRMLATLGMVIIDGDMTCPIFGYDTSQPTKLALYRRISIFSIRYAKERQLNFNMSSGAPNFKTNRGAKSQIEYSFVYIKHLNLYQRVVWRCLSFITRSVYQTLLKRYRL